MVSDDDIIICFVSENECRGAGRGKDRRGYAIHYTQSVMHRQQEGSKHQLTKLIKRATAATGSGVCVKKRGQA